MKQGDAIRVDSTCSRRRRQVCERGCFNHGNVISSERDDRLGCLEVSASAVAVMGNLRSDVRLRTSRTDRVGDRGTPEVEGQVKGSVESRVSGIVNRPCLDVENLSVQGDVPIPQSAIEECVEAGTDHSAGTHL